MARTAIATTEGTGGQTLLETAPSLSHHTSIPTGTLRLRAVPAESRHIRWSEEVIDNEGLGRKKSKLCCIYHKTREAGESSSENDSDSDSSSDSRSSSDSGGGSDHGNHDDGQARMSRKTKRENGRPGHGIHNDECGHCGGGSAGKDRVRKKRRNAYEKAPKVSETKK